MIIKNVAAINEKGNVKPAVRKVILDHIEANPEVFAEAERVEGKNVFTLPVEDANGNFVFVNFDVTVSNMAAADRAPRKVKAKAKAEDEDIVID